MSRRTFSTVAAISIGNALEWFDFVVFGFFAPQISKAFFPAENPTTSFLLAFATFGTAYFIRPLGAVVLGDYADRRGRKPALVLSMLLMMFGTAIIGLTPTYQIIGVWAPILAVFGRLIQGFSTGGEFGTATAYLVEQPTSQKAFSASWQFAGQGIAAVLATLFGLLMSELLSTEQFAEWGWRIPFLFGVAIAPIAIYIRNRLPESPQFKKGQRKHSLHQFSKQDYVNVTVTVGLVLVLTVATYTLLFLPSFAVKELGIKSSDAFRASFITSILQVAVILVSGLVSDKKGAVMGLMLSSIGLLLATYPLFIWLLAEPTALRLLLVQVSLGFFTGLYAGSLPSMMSKLFHAAIRPSGLSISYSLSVSLFGGFAPLINAALIEITKSKVAACYYLIAAAALSVVAIIKARRIALGNDLTLANNLTLLAEHKPCSEACTST